MKRKKALLLLVLALLLSIFLAACAEEPEDTASPTDDSTEKETDTESGKSTQGAGEKNSGTGGGDLVIATLSDAVSMDPAGSNDNPSSNVQANIFESLTKQDQNMEVQPSLAESWEEIDEVTWEFKLREGVTFHDGSEFNAEVVKANIERLLDPEVASPRVFLYEMISKIEVVDDYTVRFVTEYPFSPLPAHLAHSGGGMVSLEQIEADYAAMEEGEEPGSVINGNPIGTGFFKFDEWRPGELLRLVRNDDYWGEPAKLDSVTFKVVDETLTRVAELETGEAHIADPISPNNIAQIEATDGIHVSQQGSVSLSYVGFNMEKEPFNDPLVRQAINMAIDKEQIINGIYEGVGTPAIGPLAPDVLGYDPDAPGLEYDPDKARELLAEAGYENGFSTTLWTNDNQERMDAATNIQAQLAEFGIEVEIEVVEWGAYLEQTANGEHDMFILGWSTVTGDADYGLYPLFHSNNVGEPGNRTFTKDPELDELLDHARQEGDPETRQQLYSEIQVLLTDIAPMLYIHHQDFLLGVSDKVEGLTQSPTQILQLHEVTITE
ncbi:glutathione ABC transporter substrate-binding protein [Oceanobacillus piezotolerans]|uniref:Glutathione ABC transporter substrate-binding protein n=1 Tax=Oceanobacillus piezotolerans TaxID=2448030 RepID=A0A498DHB7_9BACI|nr:glutathione ABC transporter substrate-binding protein [Oceanobacillus piezotolerans]RLL47899.1 glutathione ABC transporter substrate-binding protein [Oceanobacillus piezotolerans]